MESKSVILYFGSFNPIHNGHISIANQVLECTDNSELWFVVSPQNPFKSETELASEADRLKMVELAINEAAEDPAKKHATQMKACDVELTMPRPSWTANTLRKLSKDYPNYRFTLLIGSDNVGKFDQWKDFSYITKNYPIIVYPREGYDCSNEKFDGIFKPLENVPLLPYAATDIRKIIKAGKDIDSELPPSVWNYIKEKKLYGFGI